ncbi:hepatocyte growth factor receptor-like [Branchiostoma floridae x Branchiostoma japonicum]
MPCAVKTLFDTASPPEMNSFLREGLRMVNFKHDNVLQLIGMCIHGNDAMIVLPYMKHGDLHKYLKEKQDIVHRDLAARNCMLDENLHVKVADFGLCRDVHEKGCCAPNRACPIPCPFRHGTWHCPTAPWSYGIVLWEIFSGGKTPYPDVRSVHLKSYLKAGNRMERPNKCPVALYNGIMRQCWQNDPTKRPMFKEILAKVKHINSQKQYDERQLEFQDTSFNMRSDTDSEGPHTYLNFETGSE